MPAIFVCQFFSAVFFTIFIKELLLMFFFEVLLNILGVILPVLIAVAYLTLFERKVMAGMQQRRGPVLVGYYGLLQPLADGLKLFLKETIFPTTANTIIFILAPVLTFLLSLIAWGVIPFSLGAVLSDINVGVLYLLAVSGIGVYGIITAGWASNTKYAFLGALRSAAQMISYEVSMGLIILCVLFCAGSLNFSAIVLAQQTV
jgi:NADH-quinone oxidoreductase subunit H